MNKKFATSLKPTLAIAAGVSLFNAIHYAYDAFTGNAEGGLFNALASLVVVAILVFGAIPAINRAAKTSETPDP